MFYTWCRLVFFHYHLLYFIKMLYPYCIVPTVMSGWCVLPTSSVSFRQDTEYQFWIFRLISSGRCVIFLYRLCRFLRIPYVYFIYSAWNYQDTCVVTASFKRFHQEAVCSFRMVCAVSAWCCMFSINRLCSSIRTLYVPPSLSEWFCQNFMFIQGRLHTFVEILYFFRIIYAIVSWCILSFI